MVTNEESRSVTGIRGSNQIETEAMVLAHNAGLTKAARNEHALGNVPFAGECVMCKDPFRADDPCCLTADSGLGHAWALVQAELSNYRRISDGDDWFSPYFSVQKLLDSLTTKESLEVDYIKDDMLKPYCRCGSYLDMSILPPRQEMFKHHCANMDGSHDAWDRTSFIEQPRLSGGRDHIGYFC